MQDLDPATVPDRDHPARGTAGQLVASLHIEQQAAVITDLHGQDVHALDTEQFIGPGAPRRTGPTRTVSHSRPSGQVAWSLPILGGLEPFPPYATPTVTSDSPTLNSEEPEIDAGSADYAAAAASRWR